MEEDVDFVGPGGQWGLETVQGRKCYISPFIQQFESFTVKLDRPRYFA